MARANNKQNLDAELAALEAMPLAQLRSKWSDTADGPVPKVSAALLRLALAWQLPRSGKPRKALGISVSLGDERDSKNRHYRTIDREIIKPCHWVKCMWRSCGTG